MFVFIRGSFCPKMKWGRSKRKASIRFWIKICVWQSVRGEGKALETAPWDSGYEHAIVPIACYCSLTALVTPPPLYPVTFGRCTPAVGMERHHRGGGGRPQTILYTRCKPELVGGWAAHWVPHIPQGVPNPPPGLQSWARWHLPGARQLPKAPPASQWAPPASKSHLATPALRILTPENQFLFFCLMTRCLMNVCCQFPFHQVGRVMQRFVDTTNSVLEFFLI